MRTCASTSMGDRAAPRCGWRDAHAAASEVFATWHPQGRWWRQPTNPATATYSLRTSAQDRTYYRVCCRGSAGEQVFGLYHDTVTLTSVVDMARD